MYYKSNWALVVPLANESADFHFFTSKIIEVLDRLESGTVYFIIDKVSKDNTLDLCNALSEMDSRFQTIWSPENKNVVDAYLKGYIVAYGNGHDFIIEMDAGLSHDPRAIPMFLRVLNEGNECAFGCRFINGGSIWDSSFKRLFISKTGTYLSNFLLGTSFKDMTSGFQGFHAEIVGEFLKMKFHSKAHFYQTELRYLLRKKRIIEVPIHYRAPSPSISSKAIRNAISVLLYYFFKRIF